MAKTLELEFVTEYGKPARLSVENPKEPIEEAVVLPLGWHWLCQPAWPLAWACASQSAWRLR